MTSMYVTPPYELASRDTIASSVTQGIIDPRTDEYIGQSLVDFEQFEVLNTGLVHADHAFHFVITPTSDKWGTDTVVPPTGEVQRDIKMSAIGDLLLPHDDKNSPNRQRFDEIVGDMKKGGSSLQNFTRTASEVLEDGSDTVVRFYEETIWLAYDPIYIRALDAVQSDDFSRGLNISKPLVYSIGVGRSLESLQKPFCGFREDAERELRTILAVYIGLTILISLLATAVACRISVTVTRPMITLLNVVQNINSGKIEDDIPPLYGGAREVNQVYTSFAKLVKVVRVSNNAFFTRNLHWACHFVRDALKLFTKIDDGKAIAIASSNLGNTLLAINCGRPAATRCTCLMMNSSCVVNEAFLHFEKAVRSGTYEFENAETMAKKVEFAQQLSDRHFNRGLYFLLSTNDPCAEGSNFEERGIQDLMKAQALDLDVQEHWIQNGLLMQNASVLFGRLLRRLNGLSALLENGIAQHIWDPKVVASDCHRVLSAVWDDPDDALFEEFTPIGRLQQLEGALINLQVQRNQVGDAARIAMRMLIEDEYINEAAFQDAAEAFLKHSHAVPSSLSKQRAQHDVRHMLKSCKQGSLQAKKCVFYSMEFSEACHLKSPELQHQLLTLYDAQCAQDDFFGLVASNSNNPLGKLIELSMENKQEQEDEQRRQIELALEMLGNSPMSPLLATSSADQRLKAAFNNPLSSTSSMKDLGFLSKPIKACKALNAALDKVIESEVSAIYDTYIFYICDGPKRGWDWNALSSLKSRIEETNATRKADVHLIIFDLEFPQEGEAEAKDYLKECTNLCKASQGSKYLKASLGSLDDDFQAARACLSSGNRPSAQCSNALLSGITMEKF